MPTETSAGYFPDTFNVQWDYKPGTFRRVIVKTSKTGIEERRRLTPARDTDGTGHRGGYEYLEGTFAYLSNDDKFTILDFIDQMEGNLKAFYIFLKETRKVSNYYLIDVAGASSIVVPAKELNLTSVTVNNVSKAFTVTENIGAGGEARINFTAGVQTGPVRVTGKLRLRLLVRFNLPETLYEGLIEGVAKDFWAIPISVKQVRSS